MRWILKNLNINYCRLKLDSLAKFPRSFSPKLQQSNLDRLVRRSLHWLYSKISILFTRIKSKFWSAAASFLDKILQVYSIEKPSWILLSHKCANPSSIHKICCAFLRDSRGLEESCHLVVGSRFFCSREYYWLRVVFSV